MHIETGKLSALYMYMYKRLSEMRTKDRTYGLYLEKYEIGASLYMSTSHWCVARCDFPSECVAFSILAPMIRYRRL